MAILSCARMRHGYSALVPKTGRAPGGKTTMTQTNTTPPRRAAARKLNDALDIIRELQKHAASGGLNLVSDETAQLGAIRDQNNHLIGAMSGNGL